MPPLWILFVLLPVLGGAERFNCRGRILGAYYADAKSGCKAFHVCVRVAGGGIRDFRFFCPPGTLFHQEAQTCTDWGDDDPLACPAEIYDGQFDLYKIGSGYDTKKVSSSGHRDEDSEFGLQRAETGDRRLSQNNGASDLRAAHSSDFFSGQRDRGRDDSAPIPAQSSPQPHNSQARQSFRRATTPKTTPITTEYTNAATHSRQPQKQAQYDPNSKRKLVRKRPVYVSTPAPATTFAQQNINTEPPRYSQQPQVENNYSPIVVPDNHRTIPPVSIPPEFKEYKDEYVEVSRVTPKPNKYFNSNPQSSPFTQSSPVPNNNFNKKDGLVELYSFNTESTPYFKKQNNNGPFNVPAKHTESSSGFNKQNRNGAFNVSPKHTETTAAFNNNGPFNAAPKRTETSPNYNKQNNNGAFNVQDSFSISDGPKESDFVRIRNGNANNKVRIAPTTIADFSHAPSRATSSTPAYKNVNSVSYESEKNNFVPYSKQNYFNNPTTSPSTTTYETTTHYEPLARLNTVAYNTNLGFNAQNSNFADSEEDDGQYRPPQGEDDGQYRPELYERELLSGAHSLNIAASGNRLPADQKPRGKPQTAYKSASHTAAPRPFRPAPTPSTPAPTPQVSENYPTTVSPQTQRTFDYFQTYTTTSRPSEPSASPVSFKYETSASVRPVTSPAPRTQEPRVQTRPPPPPPSLPPTPPPRPSTRPPHFAKPANKQEDSSYDYAYYDSDPGFSEYDHIEEFGRTKTKQ